MKRSRDIREYSILKSVSPTHLITDQIPYFPIHRFNPLEMRENLSQKI